MISCLRKLGSDYILYLQLVEIVTTGKCKKSAESVYLIYLLAEDVFDHILLL